MTQLSTCNFACYARRAPLYPKYQVAGRERFDSTAWSYDEPLSESVNDFSRGDSDVVSKPLERSFSYESAPTPTAPRFPTIDLAKEPASSTHTWLPVRRAVSEDFTDEVSQAPGKKRHRYLRDVDRRSIIQRIDNGEKQADLAREFGVTRAAICHMKKNRDEIVSRYESLLASAQELERSVSTPTRTLPLSLCELTQPSVQLLLTTLRDVATSHRTFRTSAKRLMTVLIEEAMVSSTTVACTLRTTHGYSVSGLQSVARSVCCVAVGENGLPLVQRCREIDPSSCIGGAKIVVTTEHRPTVDRLDLPQGMVTDVCVLLLSVSSATGESLCASVQALQRVGFATEDIQIAVLVCTSSAVDRICSQFPGIRILTCAVETPATAAPKVTTLGDFLDRYNNVKRESTSMDQNQWDEPADYEKR